MRSWGDQSGLDFDVDSYNTYARLPGRVSKYAEAMACSSDWLYVAAKNVMRRIALRNTPIDTDPGSPPLVNVFLMKFHILSYQEMIKLLLKKWMC
ncbi:baseplate wedge subunit [Klebsiella phage CPRSA]|nr:baseplate wedge subunit [Klebsiella phage CPRSA]